jgi:hypothetical protein
MKADRTESCTMSILQQLLELPDHILNRSIALRLRLKDEEWPCFRAAE